jgi:hypothetical protein
LLYVKEFEKESENIQENQKRPHEEGVKRGLWDRTSVLSFFHFWAVKTENYGSVFDFNERLWQFAHFS